MFNWLKNERCAEIELLGLFPAYVGVREFAEADRGVLAGRRAEIVFAAADHGFVVDETAVAADLVVAHQTVGGFEFDHADHVADRCEEFFVRDDVPHGDRREETEAVVGREVLRAVVAEVTLDEVAVVVVVGDTARNALMAVGKRFSELLALSPT